MTSTATTHIGGTTSNSANLDRKTLAVYVVSNWEGGGNDRVKKLLRLRREFAKLVLVTPGKKTFEDDERLMAKPLPNPLTGPLRIFGLLRLKEAIDKYLFFPSRAIFFVYAIRRRLRHAIGRDLEKGRRVCLLTTAPPHALGLLGLYVKRRFPQVRWINDWQDLWSYDENYFFESPPLYRDRVRRLERKMLAEADMNLATNAHAKQVLEQVYEVPTNQVHVIQHHFSRDDLAGRFAATANGDADFKSRTIRIGFLGTLFKPPRVPGERVLEALERLRDAGLDVELHVHGRVPREIAERHLRRPSPGLVVHDGTAHEEAVAQLARYDFLLVFLADLPNCKAVMSIKLPHYLMVGRPILAIVPEPSAMADIVRQTGSGFVLPVQGDWQTQLSELLRASARRVAGLSRDNAAIEAFSWWSVSQDWLRELEAAHCAETPH